MDCTLIGYKHVVYEFSDNTVPGFRLYVVIDDNLAIGTAVENLFISERKLGGLNLDDMIQKPIHINYNKYGKISDIRGL
jgi:hypothetical protein